MHNRSMNEFTSVCEGQERSVQGGKAHKREEKKKKKKECPGLHYGVRSRRENATLPRSLPSSFLPLQYLLRPPITPLVSLHPSVNYTSNPPSLPPSLTHSRNILQGIQPLLHMLQFQCLPLLLCCRRLSLFPLLLALLLCGHCWLGGFLGSSAHSVEGKLVEDFLNL